MGLTTTGEVDQVRIRSRRMLGRPVDAPRKLVRAWVRNDGLIAAAALATVKNDPAKGYWEDWVFADDLKELEELVERDETFLVSLRESDIDARREHIAKHLKCSVNAIPRDPSLWTPPMQAAEAVYVGETVEHEFLRVKRRPINPLLKVEVVKDLPPLAEPKNAHLAEIASALRDGRGDGGEVASLKAELAELRSAFAEVTALLEAQTAPRSKKG